MILTFLVFFLLETNILRTFYRLQSLQLLFKIFIQKLSLVYARQYSNAKHHRLFSILILRLSIQDLQTIVYLT